MREVDFIIVGQGMAGTCLAWELRALGASVVVIDREAPVTSSRVAAGLITPVTGKRLVKTWRWEQLRAAAWEFYQRLEVELGCSLLRETSMVKVFASPEEREFCEKRMRDPEYAGLLREAAELPAGVTAPHGSCELWQGGQLDVAGFLNQSRERFADEGCYQAGELSLPKDVVLVGRREALDPPGVELPCFGLRARQLIFCQGIDARSNPWFTHVEFNPARGEMLIVRIPSWIENRIIHGSVWIAPIVAFCSAKERSSSKSETTANLVPTPKETHLYRVGATYDWGQLDSGPTSQGRCSLVESLDQLLHVPYEIVDHQSAVRPILKHLNPVLGMHPRYPQLGYFNGLASKGSLQAPHFARQFAMHLVHQTPIEREVDLQHRVPGTMNHT